MVYRSCRSSLLCLATLLLSSVLAHPASAQITNGNFSAGLTGFSSDYTLVPTDHTVFTNQPDYAVISDPSTAFTNGYPSFGDHTTGTGLMLFGDGSANANDRIWYQTVNVLPNTTYTFSAWAASAGGTNLADLTFYSDSTLLGDMTVNPTGGAFTQFSTTFTTGNVTSTVLAIRDANTIAFGNDFVVDDINLAGNFTAAATPEPGSLALFVGIGLSGGVLLRRRRSRRSA